MFPALNISMTKEEVLQKIEEIKPDFRVFKSTNTSNMSLTYDGLSFIKTFIDDNVYEINTYLKGTDIINFNKLCKTPYHYNPVMGRIYHFDPEIHFLANLYQQDFLQYLREAVN